MIIGTKTSHHGLNIVGYRRATYSYTNDAKMRIRANLIKIGYNMDCSLKLDCMNKELLVIVNHHVTVNLISDGY